uniref:Secreted protein n=1 Tax=Alexandrium catenella TaxID=2925 RepID=A0A7S1LRN8_ALECA
MKSWELLALALALAALGGDGLHVADDSQQNVSANVTPSDGFKLACPPEEHMRYRTIVCSAALQKCTSEWCARYRHGWVRRFGACAQYGCATVG